MERLLKLDRRTVLERVEFCEEIEAVVALVRVRQGPAAPLWSVRGGRPWL